MKRAAWLTLFVLAIGLPALADVIPITSTGGEDWTRIAGGAESGTAEVIEGNPVWHHSPLASWISYGQTSSFGPANGSIYRFYETFTLPGVSNQGSIWVFADDTARVTLDGTNILATEQLTQGTYCSGQPIGCVTEDGLEISLDGLSQGTHTLWFDVYQRGGDGFGLLYYGSVSSTPEPASLLITGLGLLGLAAFGRRRLRRD